MRDQHIPVQWKRIQCQAQVIIQPSNPSFKASDRRLSKLKVFQEQHKFPLDLITIIIVRGTGVHKQCFTATASGKMLQPFVTFKAKTNMTIQDIHFEELINTVQPKGWIDGSFMFQWIDKVLLKHNKRQHALLIFNT